MTSASCRGMKKSRIRGEKSTFASTQAMRGSLAASLVVSRWLGTGSPLGTTPDALQLVLVQAKAPARFGHRLQPPSLPLLADFLVGKHGGLRDTPVTARCTADTTNQTGIQESVEVRPGDMKKLRSPLTGQRVALILGRARCQRSNGVQAKVAEVRCRQNMDEHGAPLSSAFLVVEKAPCELPLQQSGHEVLDDFAYRLRASHLCLYLLGNRGAHLGRQRGSQV